MYQEYFGSTDLLVRDGVEQPIDVIRAIHIGGENRSWRRVTVHPKGRVHVLYGKGVVLNMNKCQRRTVIDR